MTSNPSLPEDEELALWRLAKRRLQAVHLGGGVDRERIETLRQALPSRTTGESVTDWVRRASGKAEAPKGEVAGNVVALAPKKRLRPVAEIVRLAADSFGEEPQLPDPNRPIETPDGQFRLTIRAQDGGIAVILSALGLASELYAGKNVVIADTDHEIVADLYLNEDGDGAAVIEDSLTTRKALLRPVICLVED
jgi:hypothetical protein